MPKKKTFQGDFDDPDDAPPCNAGHCREKGLYRAPKSPTNSREFYWFCLEHVRAYNQAWDYFKGMDKNDIESFMHDAVTGHRPTWRIGDGPFPSRAKLQEKLHEFLDSGNPKPQARPKALSPKEYKAMQLFELELPVNENDIKKRYKTLVKRHHPDVNKGSKKAEETFKEVTIAYKILLTRFGQKP